MQRRAFRFILYFLPALMDCITGIIFFIGPVRATLLGYDPFIASSVVASRSICCCLFSFVISRYLTSRNAVALMYISNFALFFFCLLGLGATNLLMLYITSGLSGAATVTFAVALQMFMKVVDSGENRPVSRVVGSYTMSWCFGMSLGPFITGFLMKLGTPEGGGESIGWMYTYLVAAGLSLVMFGCFLWLRKTSGEFMRQHRLAAAKRAAVKMLDAAPAEVKQGVGKPDLAWLGWLTAMFGVCINGIVRGVFPAGVTRAGMPEWDSGLIMMLMSIAMGTSALVLSYGNKWMWSAKSMFSLGVLGVFGLGFYYLPLLMGWDMLAHYWPFFIAALVFGAYSGNTYLYSAFHALVHPDKDGRNISLNETSIGIGMMVGPLLGGWIAKHYGFYPPFMVASALVLCIAIIQAFVHSRRKTA